MGIVTVIILAGAAWALVALIFCLAAASAARKGPSASEPQQR